jgi:hypothetical protein
MPQGADTAGYGSGYHYSAKALVGGQSNTLPFVLIATDGLPISFVSDTLSHELVERSSILSARPCAGPANTSGARRTATRRRTTPLAKWPDVCDPAGRTT